MYLKGKKNNITRLVCGALFVEITTIDSFKIHFRGENIGNLGINNCKFLQPKQIPSN